MIWATIFGAFRNPAAVAGVGLIAAVGAFYAGKMIGHAQGVAHQKAEQAEADREQSEQIRERVRDALDEIGSSTSDDDIDRILRGLAGE